MIRSITGGFLIGFGGLSLCSDSTFDIFYKGLYLPKQQIKETKRKMKAEGLHLNHILYLEFLKQRSREAKTMINSLKNLEEASLLEKKKNAVSKIFYRLDKTRILHENIVFVDNYSKSTSSSAEDTFLRNAKGMSTLMLQKEDNRYNKASLQDNLAISESNLLDYNENSETNLLTPEEAFAASKKIIK